MSCGAASIKTETTIAAAAVSNSVLLCILTPALWNSVH
jgi:hypothetical protein